MSEPIEKISAVEESPGVVSMMRWLSRGSFYVYAGSASSVAGIWIANAVMVIINGTGDFHWIPGISIIGATAAMKGVTELLKTVQKRTEVSGDIQEKQIQSDQQIQQGITETAKEVSK